MDGNGRFGAGGIWRARATVDRAERVPQRIGPGSKAEAQILVLEEPSFGTP